MITEAQLVIARMLLLSKTAEFEAMQVANIERLKQGLAPAYSEEAYLELSKEVTAGATVLAEEWGL